MTHQPFLSHFMSSSREREKRDRKDSTENEREETEINVNDSEETDEKNASTCWKYLPPFSNVGLLLKERICSLWEQILFFKSSPLCGRVWIPGKQICDLRATIKFITSLLRFFTCRSIMQSFFFSICMKTTSHYSVMFSFWTPTWHLAMKFSSFNDNFLLEPSNSCKLKMITEFKRLVKEEYLVIIHG